jgi:PAS domain S-box-containing protein
LPDIAPNLRPERRLLIHEGRPELEFLKRLLSSDFLPHGTCYLWNPKIVWLHVISDSIITLSYYCIPVALIYLVRKRRDIPFNWIFWMFGLFILGCGTTHLMEVWTVWHPTYLLSGTIKAMTAAVSIATAIVLLQLLPKAIALPSVDQLYGLNRELERQVDTRDRREQELTRFIEELELRVKERTAELELMNQSLEREIAIGVEAPLRRWAMAGTAVALLATGFMGFLCWRSVIKAATDAAGVSHTQEVRSSLETTLRHVDDIETGTRAFEVREEDSFLKPYLEGQRAIPGDIQALRVLIADNPSQNIRLATLESQVDAKVEYSRRMVAEKQRTGNLATQATFLESDRIMTRVRDTVALMDGAERALLDERTQESLLAQRRTRTITVFTTLASTIFLFLAGSAVSREARRSAQLRGQLKKINTDLEDRVEQRTSALQESEARLSSVIESAKDAILTIDEEQRILLFNAAAEKMFGCDASETLGHSLERLIPERFRAAHAQHIHRFGDTGVTTRGMGGAIGQLWGLRADGTEFPIEASISQTEAGGRKLFTVILRDITERKQADEIRERLAAVVESSDDAIIGKNLQGTINAWNTGAEKLFGYSSSETLGKPMLMLFPPERTDEESEILARIRRGESLDHFETVRVRKDGKRIDISATVSPLRGSNGAIIGASQIARDITERKRAEDALRESLATSQAALKDLGDQKFALDQHAIVAITDVQGTIIYVNEKFCAISKYSKEELIGQNHRILNSGHHSKDFFKLMYQNIANGKVWHDEIKNQAKDGSIYWVDTTIVPFVGANGKPRQYLAIRADITERKRAEDAFKESLLATESALRELADQKFALDQHAIVAITDVQGTITYVNEKFCAISKYSREELIGQNHRILNSAHHPKDFFKQMYQTIANGKVWHDEIKNRAKDGSMYWVDTTIVPFLGAEGKPRQYVAIRADITERKLAAEGLAVQASELSRQAEQRRADEQEIRNLNDELEHRVIERTSQLEAANKELEAFTYSVSHDLRAPLRHIAGFSKMLAEESGVSLQPEAQHYLQRIQDGTRRMGTLVDDLLNLARIGRHELRVQVTGLDSIVRDVIADLAPDLEVRKIEWKIGKLPYVEGDPALLKVVFQNLLSNAVKYTQPRADAIIEVFADQVDGGQVVCVRDNGVGFNMNYADKLFGVFQRLHRAEDFEGTGVGLATVQRIVQKHGGRIWAQAELDKGAAFYVSLGNTKRENKAATVGEIS